jgi:hypothetical protein
MDGIFAVECAKECQLDMQCLSSDSAEGSPLYD